MFHWTEFTSKIQNDPWILVPTQFTHAAKSICEYNRSKYAAIDKALKIESPDGVNLK